MVSSVVLSIFTVVDDPLSLAFRPGQTVGFHQIHLGGDEDIALEPLNDFRGIKVICTYHPAYVLRTPEAKRPLWEDIQLLMKEMGLPVGEKK